MRVNIFGRAITVTVENNKRSKDELRTDLLMLRAKLKQLEDDREKVVNGSVKCKEIGKAMFQVMMKINATKSLLK